MITSIFFIDTGTLVFCFCATFSFILYSEYNTVIKPASTPVPTMDNRHIYIYNVQVIHTVQKGIDIETAIQSWTKYFIDRYLPFVFDCNCSFFLLFVYLALLNYQVNNKSSLPNCSTL